MTKGFQEDRIAIPIHGVAHIQRIKKTSKVFSMPRPGLELLKEP
jgi:hypothetical protein